MQHTGSHEYYVPGKMENRKVLKKVLASTPECCVLVIVFMRANATYYVPGKMENRKVLKKVLASDVLTITRSFSS